MDKNFSTPDEKTYNYTQFPLIEPSSSEDINKMPTNQYDPNNFGNAPQSSQVYQQPIYDPNNMNQNNYNPPNTQMHPPNMGTTNTVVINQTSANTNLQYPVVVIPHTFKSEPKWIQCPSCSSTSFTRVDKQCNAANTCCCICGGFWFGLLGVGCWAIMNACREKDVNCYDAQHYCMTCGTKIADYSAC